MPDCIFCKIAEKDIPTEIVKETEKVLVFRDNDPSAETHLLIIPKEHIKAFVDISNSNLFFEMVSVAQEIVNKNKFKKYRLIINGGSYQEVPHLHIHLLAGNLTKRAKELLLDDN